MSERISDRLMVVLAAVVLGVLVFGVVVALVPTVEADNLQRTPENGAEVLAGLVAGLVAVAGVLAVSPLMYARSHRGPLPEGPAADPRAEERAALVRGLISLLLQLPDGLVWQAEGTLAKAGVRQVVPDGEPVDPHRHHVVGTEVPADASRADTVARTVRPGYADGDRLILCPKVVVYTMDQQNTAPR